MLNQFIRALLGLLFFFQICTISAFASDHGSALVIEYAHNPYGWPAFHYATLMQRPDIAKLILEIYPEQATQSTPPIPLMDSHFGNNASQDYDYFTGNYENGTSALELAVRFGDVALVEQLLDLGANPNESRLEWVNVDANDPYRVRLEWQPYLADNWEPRGQARVYGHFKFAWTRDWDLRSILYWALVRNNCEMVGLLLDRGATISSPCYTSHRQFRLPYTVDKSDTAFAVALHMGSDQLFTQLLSHQAKRELSQEEIDFTKGVIQNPQNLPPLTWAIVSNDLATFIQLLELGFDPQQVLPMAVDHENPEFLQQILNARESYGDSALEQAIQNKNSKLVAELLDYYAPNKGHLELAVGLNHLEITRLILESKEKIEPYPQVMEQAIKGADTELSILLMSHGYSHPAALTLAIQYHRKDIFFLLLPLSTIDDAAFQAAIIYNEPKIFEALYSAACPFAEQILSYKKLAIQLSCHEILSFLQE